MTPINSINNLDWRKFRSCNYIGVAGDDGTFKWTTESGIRSNISRWYSHRYTLVLQALTVTEFKNIIVELLNAEKNGKRCTILKSKIEKYGYIDFKTVQNDPNFICDVENIGYSRIDSTNLWNLSIPLVERLSWG